MARYRIKFSCGHEGTVNILGSAKERDGKIEYLEQFGVCPNCLKRKEAEQKKDGDLLLRISPMPDLDAVRLWFDGNYMPYIDNIKSLKGYRFSQFGEDPSKHWNKVVLPHLFREELKKAEKIGAVIVKNPSAEAFMREVEACKTEYNKTELKKIGFTEKLIELLLPEPRLEHNPYNRNQPIKLWRVEDVEKAMSSAEFLAYQEKRGKRIKTWD